MLYIEFTLSNCFTVEKINFSKSRSIRSSGEVSISFISHFW